MPEQNERTTAPVSKTLGVIMESYACRHEGAVYMHFSHGRVIDRLAQRYEGLLLCLPLRDAQPDVSRDYRLQSENIEIVPQPFYTRSFQAVRHPWGIARAYIRTCRKSDRLFLRGMLPYVGILYATAFLLGRRICHWIVGNPLACLSENRRIGRWMDALSIVYAWQDRLVTRVGRWLTRGCFVCNGQELGRLFRSPKTLVTVSSTVAEGEFHERQHTCQGPVIRLLYVGFVRPEKGLEYLLEAVSRLKMDRPWELVVVGRDARWYPEYGTRLDELADKLGVREHVRWHGYVPYGPELFGYLRRADVFVFPTLSEGTPRVLVEARANSLPVVSTNVGGIPTSVTNGVDGLLVPPRDASALARAVERILGDGPLRRLLIRNGLQSARNMTVDRFVELITEVMESKI
jgi:glycosyltransferase involved in cell wall biosynthesis